jgi:GAF domain-containing protein/multidrug resistance efflux pump
MTHPTIVGGLEALRADRLRHLIRLSQEFNSNLEIEALLPRVLDLVLEVLEADAGSLWLRDGELIRCRLARGPAADEILDLELPIGAGVVGDVVKHQRSSLIEEAADDSRFLHQVDAATGFRTRSMLTVPLLVRGDCVGAVQILNPRSESGRFSEEDLHFLEALADDAAAAIRNASLFEAERRARDLAALLEVSHEITASLDLDRVLLSLVNLAGRAVRFERCIAALWREERLEVQAISGEAKVDRKSAAVRELERFLLWAAERRAILHVQDSDAADDETAVAARRAFPAYFEQSRARGFLLVPMKDSEGDLGVLHFEFPAPGYLERWGREAAELLANEATLAIRNAQLYADVPFISWLEPLAQTKRSLLATPGATWLRYALTALAILAVLLLIRLPLRIGASEATLRSAVQVPVRAGVAGIVDAVLVREGETVRDGALLATLRNEELLLRLRQAEADAALAEREIHAAHGRGDAAGAMLARVRAAQAAEALALLRADEARTRILAPAAGVVLTSRVEERVGSHLAAGDALAWIGDPDWAEIELLVRQQDLNDVRAGDRVRAKVGAHPDVIFEGRVIAIAPRADATRLGPAYPVRAILDNRQHLLRPGMTAQAKVVTQPRTLATFLFRRPIRWLRMTFWW